MIVDTSAIVATLRERDDRFLLAMVATPSRMSAATYLETAVVIDGRRDPVMSRRLDDLLEIVSMRIEPVTGEHAQIARQAYRDFGKGSGHPAKLNFGDCFSYALASVAGEPLLFKGNDFTHTDLRSALD